MDYSYDDLWRREAMAVANGGLTQYAYDALGRLDGITSPAGTWDYSYVGNTGMLSQITNPNTTKSVYSYDALERLTQVANQKNTNANLSTFAYGFDDALDPQRDVRTTLDKTIGANPTQRVAYGYDGVDQLTSEVLSQGGTPQWSKSFAYDVMGNRTSAGSVTPTETVSNTYTNNRLNQIVGHSSSWGGGANTLTSTLQYDQGGNLTRQRDIGTGSATSSHTEYVYDDIDRLTAVIKKNATTLANESKTEFQYDGFSRLKISKEFTWSGSAWSLVSNSEKRRVYDGMDVVQERNGSNSVTVTYTRDGNIGGLLSRRTSGVSYFYHYDGSGNVVGMTDSSQNSVAVVWAAVEIGGALYDAYTTIETWRDPCADGWEKVTTSGLFIAGLPAPGAGYGTAGKPAIRNLPNPSRMLGKPSTRRHIDEVATEMEKCGWEITGGGGRFPEEYLPGPGGGRRGSSRPDITATKDGRTLRVNTVDTRADGLTPNTREARNAARIRGQRPGDHLLLIPKP